MGKSIGCPVFFDSRRTYNTDTSNEQQWVVCLEESGRKQSKRMINQTESAQSPRNVCLTIDTVM